jgi:hypothetical protein
MDDTQRTAIILAAVSAAGPPTDDADWEATVAQAATRITAMLREGSAVSRAISQVEASTPFLAEVVEVGLERSSKRAVVTLRTRPSEHHPDGLEPARSERWDRPDGRVMARRLHDLVGHRVVVWVEREAIAGGTRKVRVVRHVEDRGLAETITPRAPERAGETIGVA